MLSKKQIHLWRNEFQNGHVNITDVPENGSLPVSKTGKSIMHTLNQCVLYIQRITACEPESV